jgi:tetratricopeptide (TPR) repeat protein
METCQERDPRNPELVGNLAATYLSLRMWTEANRAALRALAIDPHSAIGLQTAIGVSIQGTGNIEGAERTLADYPQEVEVADFNVVQNTPPAVYLKVLERDFAGALKLCQTEVFDEPEENRARLATRVMLHVLAGDAAAAQDEIGRARDLIESRLRERSNDGNALLELSWVDLALQRNAEALRLVDQATKLMPLEKDYLLGSTYLAALAEIQARAGATVEAVKTLRESLAMPNGLAIQQLKLEPTWDPIRNDPGFKELLAGKELIGPDK